MKTLLLFLGYAEFSFILGIIFGRYVVTDSSFIVSILGTIVGTIIVIVSTVLALAHLSERDSNRHA